jgi:hypothetical protein
MVVAPVIVTELEPELPPLPPGGAPPGAFPPGLPLAAAPGGAGGFWPLVLVVVVAEAVAVVVDPVALEDDEPEPELPQAETTRAAATTSVSLRESDVPMDSILLA